jgi:rhodanese-related sulfurtransferase
MEEADHHETPRGLGPAGRRAPDRLAGVPPRENNMTHQPTDNGKPMCCAPGDLSACALANADPPPTPDPKADLPQGKQTVLGLYVTAKEAHDMWQARPDKVKIIDVRTPEEYLFVGHPTMAWKIPVAAQSYEWDADKQQYPMKPLLDFVARVQTIATADDTLMVMCRSGGRSAIAVNFLAKSDFKNVYNIIDGMEGDAKADSDSVAQAQPLTGGWKHSGLPWTKKLTPERMVLPTG